jgi:hypothetical protein
MGCVVGQGLTKCVVSLVGVGNDRVSEALDVFMCVGKDSVSEALDVFMWIVTRARVENAVDVVVWRVVVDCATIQGRGW